MDGMYACSAFQTIITQGNMTSDFQTTLTALVDRAAPDLRPHMRQQADMVLQAGVDSVAALGRVAGDATQPAALRSCACWLIGHLRYKRATSALLRAFAASDAAVYWEAAKTLALFNSKRALEPLAAALHGDADEEKRVAAVYALGWLTDERTVEIILDVLKNEQETPRVRGEAAEVLAYKPCSAHIVATLVRCLADPAVEVQFWAAFALAHHGGPAEVPALEALAARSTSTAILPGWWSVRDEAQWAIIAITRPEQADELLERLYNQTSGRRGSS